MLAAEPDVNIAPFRVVVVAASAGGLTALGTLLAGLPSSFPLPIAVVQHLHPGHRSLIADILGRRTRLRVTEVRTDDRLEPGTVYIAAPGAHLEIVEQAIHQTHGAPVHFLRPSADRLFSSAAAGGKVIAVILTGTGSDGSEGARAIKSHGGVVIAQDEATAEFFGMPRSAIESGMVDYVLPLDQIAAALIALTEERHGARDD